LVFYCKEDILLRPENIQDKMRLKGYIYGCISSATYGLIPLFALPLLQAGMRYDSVLFYRFSCASLLLGLLLLFKKESFHIRKKEIVPLVILGLLFALSAQFLFWGYDYLSVGTASTLLFLYPVFVAILMAILFKERISWIAQVAILIAFVGIALLSNDNGNGRIEPFGIVLILFSAISYALYIIVVNKSSVQQMSGYKLTFYALLFSSVFFFSKAILTTGGLQLLPAPSDFINIFLLALLPTIVSCVAMVYAVRYIGSTTTAVLGALEPVSAVAVGVFVFHEVFSFNLAMGIVFIILAVTMIILSDQISSKIKFHRKSRL
jgi:drug/metabolite transporter (DMT)-like permease